MKYGRFEYQGRIFFGIVKDQEVTELSGSIFDSYQTTSLTHALSSLKTLVPCEPTNFYCAGINYLAHIEWGNQRKGTQTKPPSKADIGYRSQNALSATGQPIIIPADAPGPVQYEGELVAVIGKKAKHLTEANALSCVLGYTLGNDVSDRGWQKSDRTLWRAKNCDTWKPMGPFIVTDLDPMNLTIETYLDGQAVSSYSTSKMIFSLQHYIEKITQYITLMPGDVIWTGVDNATIPDLQHGMVCDIVQKDIGTLSNPIVRLS
jgi:2-keto-4-pentenoate hydratase/2-oxohepta-3-ene-1,7-dioic acid hydratase in catechol pathway